MAIREGAWDCPVCCRKGNRGPEKFCGGCGSPRGPEVKFYLPDDAAEVTEADIVAHCKAHLAGFKVPRAIVFGELPKTSTGKIQKFELRKKAGSAAAIDV